MADWKITVVNQTGGSGVPGKRVQIMLFQSEPDPLIVDSYSTAWHVIDIQCPGTVGPIPVPTKVDFFILDEVDKIPRSTGPFPVKFGQIVEVFQKDKVDAPKATISGKPQPEGEIKTTNMNGNAQPLEMALYKNGSKIVSYKGVIPGDAVYLSIRPVIYIADIDGKSIKEGDDFKAVVQAANATMFQLFPDIRELEIGITQKPSGELVFSLI